LALDPGTYTLSVSQKGFATATREVIGTTNFNVDLTLTLRVAVAEETVTITAKTPVGDTKKAGTGTTLTLDELSRTPNSRDPWATLRRGSILVAGSAFPALRHSSEGQEARALRSWPR